MVHPASLSHEQLLDQCRVTTGRDSGPGGQHRNKVETAVRIRHEESGFESFCGERRSQKENKSIAVFRLRLLLARGVRRNVPGAGYHPSPLWKERRQGNKLPVNPKHQDYPALLSEALDVIHARGFDVAGAAGELGVTMSQLARLVRHDRKAFAAVNEGRTARGLPPLK
jgi:hypothetical protein